MDRLFSPSLTLSLRSLDRVGNSLLAAVEVALLGRHERLVARCNVPGILAVFERWDIYAPVG